MANIIEIKNLVKKYGASKSNAVDDISFEVKEGELFSLLGVNGAGKSTTINTICTLISKTSGSVIVNGSHLGKDDNCIRRSIGVVFQGNCLDEALTVRENLMIRARFYDMTKAQASDKIDELVKKLSMTDFIDSYYGKLSGGQRRKGDLARALLAAPKVLFLDEPTTGLDPASRVELWDTINNLKLNNNMTVVLTTHYMEETENSDRVAIIDKGRLLCLDTPQALKTKYSRDTLKLIELTGCADSIEKVLDFYKYNYIKSVDTYIVEMDNGMDSIEILQKLKPFIDSFEMEKGNMDKVFLSIIGGTKE